MTDRWSAHTEPIPGDTDPNWVIGAEAEGKRISVTATGTKIGYSETSKTSAETEPVTNP